jgi:hypothetical protein
MFGFIKYVYEKFTENKNEDNAKAKAESIFITFKNEIIVGAIIMLCLFIFAVYLSFKCNKGIDIIDLLFAFFCTPCYLFYRLVLGCNNE